MRKTVHVMLIASLIIVFLIFAKELLVPIALAAFLAVLFRGLSNRMEKRGMRRWVSALLSVLILLSSVGLLLFLLSWQLAGWMENVTEMQKRFSVKLTEFRDWIQQMAGIDHAEQKEIAAAQAKGASNEAGGMAAFALTALGVLLDVFLIVVYTYLLLFYRSKIKKFIMMVIPDQHNENGHAIMKDATQVAQKYLTGLFFMIVILWVLYGIGFSVMGVEGALFFAILCGILEIIPFVGNILGTSITVLAVVVQDGGTGMILGVIAVYVIVQTIQTYLLEPLIVGDQVNINPLFIIIALIAGQMLWGVAGMILAIPAFGIIKIICDHIPPLRPYGLLIGTEKQLKKIK